MYAGSGLVRFEYKHFPVIGGESVQAALASACANEQGQFWPYHDTLFLNQSGENQGAYRDDTLKTFAAVLGLDESAFDECLDSDRYRDEIEAELLAGRQQGVNSTPTLFLNGEIIQGAVPFEQLQPQIEAILDAAGE